MPLVAAAGRPAVPDVARAASHQATRCRCHPPPVGVGRGERLDRDLRRRGGAPCRACRCGRACRPCTTSAVHTVHAHEKQACSGPTTATRAWLRGARRTVWPLSIRTTASSVVFRTRRLEGRGRAVAARCGLPSDCRVSLATHGRPSAGLRPACCRTDRTGRSGRVGPANSFLGNGEPYRWAMSGPSAPPFRLPPCSTLERWTLSIRRVDAMAKARGRLAAPAGAGGSVDGWMQHLRSEAGWPGDLHPGFEMQTGLTSSLRIRSSMSA